MKATHRHTAHVHEHEFEAQRGLPEALPAGETLLWQGSPDWRMLARRAFHVRKLMVYFGALVLLRAAFVVGDGGSVVDALRSTEWPLALAVVALSLLYLLAWLSARSTVYSLTDQRVVMRIGIVLTLTFNLPHKRIAAAGVHLDAEGTGDLPLTLLPPDHIAWLHLWPHARPWRLGRPEPMLRSVPDAARVARLLSQAWSQATGLSTAAQAVAAPARSGPRTQAGGGQAALAGR
ncbi:MAG: photosynthetic complex putative assembly protein PuhB [Rubrivivax sp.]|nr:photosynthetic complex putative assembly protein PuhB [Rubrivivax sp.]